MNIRRLYLRMLAIKDWKCLVSLITLDKTSS